MQPPRQRHALNRKWWACVRVRMILQAPSWRDGMHHNAAAGVFDRRSSSSLILWLQSRTAWAVDRAPEPPRARRCPFTFAHARLDQPPKQRARRRVGWQLLAGSSSLAATSPSNGDQSSHRGVLCAAVAAPPPTPCALLHTRTRPLSSCVFRRCVSRLGTCVCLHWEASSQPRGLGGCPHTCFVFSFPPQACALHALVPSFVTARCSSDGSLHRDLPFHRECSLSLGFSHSPPRCPPNARQPLARASRRHARPQTALAPAPAPVPAPVPALPPALPPSPATRSTVEASGSRPTRRLRPLPSPPLHRNRWRVCTTG